jgi:hypothetical protein
VLLRLALTVLLQHRAADLLPASCYQLHAASTIIGCYLQRFLIHYRESTSLAQTLGREFCRTNVATWRRHCCGALPSEQCCCFTLAFMMTCLNRDGLSEWCKCCQNHTVSKKSLIRGAPPGPYKSSPPGTAQPHSRLSYDLSFYSPYIPTRKVQFGQHNNPTKPTSAKVETSLLPAFTLSLSLQGILLTSSQALLAGCQAW